MQSTMRYTSLLLALALTLPCDGAITYFDSASNPADNGANTGTVCSSDVCPAVTPPASMATGDLVILYASTRDISGQSYAMEQTSGQTWNTITACASTSNAVSSGIFWARFNGTWGSDPSIRVVSGTGAWSIIMHVFRPTTGTNTWAVDQVISCNNYAAPTCSPNCTITITGQNTTQADTVTLGIWATSDDNSWDTLTGSGWTVTGTAQYRNTSGNDLSASFAHKIQTSAAATGSPTKDQTVNGPDGGFTAIFSFYESGAPSTALKDRIGRGIIPVAR